MAELDKIEKLEEILKEDKENYQARRELAILLVDSGFAKEGAQHLLYLSKKFPEDNELFYNLGIAYEKQKMFNEAEQAYKHAIGLVPQKLDAVYNLGLVYIELKKFDEAIQCFEQVLKNDVNDSNSYFNLGICCLKKNDIVNAMMNFQNTLDLNDEDLYAHFYTGNILKDMGDLDGAKEHFERVIEISPDYSWAYYNLASISFETEDYEQTILYLKKTIELNPKDEVAYLNYSKVLVKMGLFDDARQILTSAMEDCPDIGNLFYYMAQISKHEGDASSYMENMNNALQNRDTLTIDVHRIMDELETFSKNQTN